MVKKVNPFEDFSLIDSVKNACMYGSMCIQTLCYRAVQIQERTSVVRFKLQCKFLEVEAGLLELTSTTAVCAAVIYKAAGFLLFGQWPSQLLCL